MSQRVFEEGGTHDRNRAQEQETRKTHAMRNEPAQQNRAPRTTHAIAQSTLEQGAHILGSNGSCPHGMGVGGLLLLRPDLGCSVLSRVTCCCLHPPIRSRSVSVRGPAVVVKVS